MEQRREAAAPGEAVAQTALPARLTDALARLDAGLERLHAVVERRAAATAGRLDADDEVALLREDRTRLALDLDTALLQAQRLREAHAAALARLERAEVSIEAVMRGLALEQAERDDAPEGAA